MNKLKLNETYTREDIYKIFNPEKPMNSVWKQWGIINLSKAIPEMKDDYIFLVTKGSEMNGHVFDEGITENGVLSWQSQPQNSLNSENIMKFIKHDETLNNIYLFYREKSKEEYSYFGKLNYLSHDSSREKPVYFKWQILDWEKISNENFSTHKEQISNYTSNNNNNLLLNEDEIEYSSKSGLQTDEFRARKNIDYSKKDKANKEIGLLGEKLVLEYEKKYLRNNNKPELAEKVSHHSVNLGDGLGYDILSYTLEGNKKFIEVKTTKGKNSTDFFVTPTELRRSKKEKEYYLYRVYDYSIENNNDELYIKKGCLDENFELISNEFKAKLK